MFIGRERELRSLEQLNASDQFEFVALYDRRRVGKTALLTRFIQDKPAIYFMGVESNAKQNLETLVRRSRLFPYSKAHYFLFSKSGFTKGCIERANELGCVTLVGYADMLKSYGG